MNFDSSLYLEALNGFLAACSFYMSFWMIVILWYKREDYGRMYYSAGIAIMAFHFGIAIALGWRWLYRSMENIGYDVDWMITEYWWVSVLGSIIAAIGLSCKIRVYTNPGWGNWPWILAMLLALATAAWPFLRSWKLVG